MERIKTLSVKVGKDLYIGGEHPIVVQTMCNTHTSDVEATVAQCLELAEAGAQMIRITVPGLQDVPHIKAIKEEQTMDLWESTSATYMATLLKLWQ